MHRRCEQHGRLRRQQRGGEEIVGDAMRVLADDLGGGGRHDNQVRAAAELRVWDRVGPFEQRGARRLRRQRRERQRADETLGVVGAHVVPVLTDDAQRFVGALTFSALASEPARTSLFEGPDPIPHTHLGRRADLVVVAPATAKVIGKYTYGISDDLLTATLLATKAPVLLAPAMHTEMWEHAAVQENLAVLRERGVHVIDPEEGRLAGGDTGPGRLADPARIVAAAADVLACAGDLAGLRVLVTAGGTREPIDPVRFVGNRSSGKMGYAVAERAARRGAAVTLVTTTGRPTDVSGIAVERVDTADDMARAVLSRFADSD